MKIVWAENPLQTRVELDDADLMLLKERIKSAELEDRLVTACCDLDAEVLVSNAHKTPEERIAAALVSLDADYVLDEGKRNGKSFAERLDERAEAYAQELLEPHCGDCTCVPCSCLKCRVENLLRIDTIAGLGKHAATKIGMASDGRNINEAIAWLAEYQPTYTHNPNWPREEWEKHVPRWIEEGKRAHAWLVAYRDNHFSRTTK